MTNTKPKTSETFRSLSNALIAVTELLTVGQVLHGGDFEGGRLASDNCIEECNDSMMRHFLAGDGLDTGEGGSGMHHDVAVATNALMAVEKRLRLEKEQQ